MKDDIVTAMDWNIGVLLTQDSMTASNREKVILVLDTACTQEEKEGSPFHPMVSAGRKLVGVLKAALHAQKQPPPQQQKKKK